MILATIRDSTPGRWIENVDCRRGLVALLAAAFLLAALPGFALGADDEKATQEDEEKKGFWSKFKDPEDGKLDLTASGDSGEGVFPIVLPFNEPATGPGLVIALAYFHPTKGEPPSTSDAAGGPPTATFGAGAGTTNGTWFVAGGHHHVWKDDKIRYLGAIGAGSVNLTFYGFGDEETSDDGGIDFNTKAAVLVQQAKFRVADSPLFLGVKYLYAATDTTFDQVVPELETGEAELASLGGLVDYDTRDTVFTPNSGFRVSLDLAWFDEALGGDFDYESIRTKFRYYWPIGDHWVLGFRGDFDAVGEEAPFYALPFVRLRGIPVFRYIGNYVGTIEIEPRYKIDERWSVLAFAGEGRAGRDLNKLLDAERVYNYGTGFRYLIARKLGIGTGIDIARGPEETVVYLTVGSAW